MSNDSLVFKARALAQAHPFTISGQRYLDSIIARERSTQPRPEIGEWAGHALTAGYCLRRVEEVAVLGKQASVEELDLVKADRQSTEVAVKVRTTGAGYLLSEDEVVATLDKLIGGEIERRLADLKGTLGAETWTELEDYIAWWVIKGYALRVAETRI